MTNFNRFTYSFFKLNSHIFLTYKAYIFYALKRRNVKANFPFATRLFFQLAEESAIFPEEKKRRHETRVARGNKRFRGEKKGGAGEIRIDSHACAWSVVSVRAAGRGRLDVSRLSRPATLAPRAERRGACTIRIPGRTLHNRERWTQSTVTRHARIFDVRHAESAAAQRTSAIPGTPEIETIADATTDIRIEISIRYNF